MLGRSPRGLFKLMEIDQHNQVTSLMLPVHPVRSPPPPPPPPPVTTSLYYSRVEKILGTAVAPPRFLDVFLMIMSWLLKKSVMSKCTIIVYLF